MTFPRPTELAHEWVAKTVSPGDTVIDATAGNGHDTVFLAQLVGENGRVFAFDIQQDALDSTRSKLLDGDLERQTQLVLASHEMIVEHVSEPISAAMFNLGYLPGGDKAYVTQPESTVGALKAAAELLRPGGIVTIVIYTGHDGGDLESTAVLDWCRRLDPELYRVVEYSSLVFRKPPPFLVAIERRA